MTSKLGVHIERRPHGWTEFVRSTRPAIVKSMDLKIVDDWSDKVVGEIREDLGAEPNIFLLGRLFLPPHQQRLDQPKQRAREFVERLKERLQLEELQLFDAIEGYNETSHNSVEALQVLAAFEAELGRLLHEENVAFATGGFSTGGPSFAGWEETWVDAFREALEVADYLHVHEYSWPTMRTRQGELCLRYRTLYRTMEEKGLAKPIIISECGLDSGAQGIMPHHGWQELSGNVPDDLRTEYLAALEEHDNDTDAFYLAQLEWYDAELQKDDYVVGATIFTYGRATDMWKSFDIADRHQLLKALGAYLAEQNDEPHPQKWKAGVTVTEPVEPEVEYKPQPFDFHYLLLGQDADGIAPWSWIEALKKYVTRFRVSLGFSLDHAAMETPFTQTRHVTLIGSPDAPMGVSRDVEDILQAAGCEIDRVSGATAQEIKDEMDRRADTGLRFG